MEKNINYKLKCGQCENDKHLIYQLPNKEILIECIKCGSVSELILLKPEIIIRNFEGLGTITNFDNNI